MDPARRLQVEAAASRSAVSTGQHKKIDMHLHVWASHEEAMKFPYFPGQEPTLPGDVQLLLKEMEAAGVDGALIVQPINHKFDHSYVASVLRQYPDKFVGCCLADPTDDGGGAKELERLANEDGFRAVRFNPYLWPSGQKMTNGVGKAMFAKAGDLGLPVGFMCFKGLHLHVEEIKALCSKFPHTTVFIDHFGFCKPPSKQEEEDTWQRLLDLAKFPQVYVKTSAFFRVSREGFPYRDTWPLVRQLADVFGPERMLWGSDFPFVMEQGGYKCAWQILPMHMEEEVLSVEEAGLVMGGTAMALFPGAWRNS